MNFFLDGFNRLRETVVNMVLGFSVVSYVSGENDLEDESNVIEEDLVRLTDLRLRYNEHLTATAAQFKSMETLRVHVCTWNVCEGAPPNTVDLVPWLRTEIRRWRKNDTSNMSSQHVGIYHESEPLPPPQDSHQNVIPDIIAIGLQEVDMGTSSVVFERTSKGIAWEPALYRAVNSLDPTSEEHYEKVCSAQLVGILLCVYVKRKHFVNVHNVRTCVSRTGAMQVLGNKGAIAARMTVYSKRFLFICAHLTPHEQNQEQRNRSYFSIIRQLHFDLPSVADDETDMSGQYFEATYGKKNEISSHDISDMDSNPTDSKLDRSRNRFPSEIFKRNSSDALDKSMNDFLNSPTSDAWRTSSLDDVAQPRAIPSFDCVPSPTSSHQGTLKHTQETTPLASTFETLRRNPSFVSPGCPPSWSTARRRTETPPRTESMQRSDSVQDEGMFPAAELPLAETYPYKSDVSENVLFAHDYVFFFGDLNYRVWNVSRDDIRSAIESKNFSSLQKHDQLKQSMLLTDAFRGFREPPINFPPTYKYVTGTFDYNTTRHNPSWTDRILYWCLGENTPLPMDLRVAMHNIQRTGIWSRFSGQESTSRRPRWNSAVKSVQGNLYLEKSESEIDLISNQQKLSRPHKSIFRRVETVPVDLSCLISGGEPLTQKGPEPNDTRECLSFHTRTSTATVCSDHTCPSDDRNLPIEDGTEGMTGGTWNGMGDETSVIHSFAHLEHPKGEHVENKITVRNYDSFPLRLSDHFPVSCSFDVHVVAINGSELRRVLTALEDIASMQK